jgi:hypothetical protein
MRKRSEDWRDLMAAYTLAFDPKKLFVGFIAVVCTVFVVWVMSMIYSCAAGAMEAPAGRVVALGQVKAGVVGSRVWDLVTAGEGARLYRYGRNLLNPFYNGNVIHFVISIATYVLLFLVWTRYGGIISRLTVLEYAKDDLPTLREAREAVGARWKDYWLAPVMPLLFIVVLTAMNALGGLVASVPFVGRILLIFPGFPMLLITSLIITLLAVILVLSFGMMMPGISAGGKDGFDAFATAYAYVIWGLRKFILFSVILLVVGYVATWVVNELIELLVQFLRESVELGFIGGMSPLSDSGFSGVGDKWFHAILMGLLVPVQAIAAAYVFSYYFTGNTIMYFLLRKDQDNIDVDEIYEELEEEDFGELEAPEEPEAAAEEAGEEAEEAQEEAGEEDSEESETPAEEETAPDEDLASEDDEEDEEEEKA